MRKNIETNKPSSSATGTANQTPSPPKNTGRISIVPTRNINVLAKDITAETSPSEKAVNIDDANMLTPIIIKLVANILNPCRVRL